MKLKTLAAATLLALTASTGAHATLFTFDPTGTAGATGDIQNVGIIDQAAGSGYADGGVTAIQSGVGSTFTLYYQANLSAMQAANTTGLFLNGTGGNFFTFTAGFGETVLSVGANNSATFGFDASNPVNYFNMYATSAIGDNLTGAGFVNGTPILTAHIISVASSNFTVQSTTGVPLDQGGGNGDQWSGQQTVTGSGTTDLRLVIDTVNSNYFPTLDPLQMLLVSFLNTSQVDPFTSVDPSMCMNTNTSTCTAGGINTVGTLGATNGLSGPSFLFQADANQTIQATVPEPGSLALSGLALAAMGALRRRGARKAA